MNLWRFLVNLGLKQTQYGPRKTSSDIVASSDNDNETILKERITVTYLTTIHETRNTKQKTHKLQKQYALCGCVKKIYFDMNAKRMLLDTCFLGTRDGLEGLMDGWKNVSK